MDRKKINWVVVFPDEWLPYSPTIINFIRCLQLKGDTCKIVTFDIGDFKGDIEGIAPVAIHLNSVLRSLLSRARILNIYKLLLLFLKLKEIGISKSDRCIGVDAIGYLAAFGVNRESAYLSLEVSKDILNRIIKKYCTVNALIIQTKERQNYLSLNECSCYFIQNAPILPCGLICTKSYEHEMIYLGTISHSHGVELCIDSFFFSYKTPLDEVT